jgi:hypothetical protein
MRQGALGGVMADAVAKAAGIPAAAVRRAAMLSGEAVFEAKLDGARVLDEPTHQRAAALDAVVPAENRVDRLHTTDPVAAQEFLDRTLAAGRKGSCPTSTSVRAIRPVADWSCWARRSRA